MRLQMPQEQEEVAPAASCWLNLTREPTASAQWPDVPGWGGSEAMPRGGLDVYLLRLEQKWTWHHFHLSPPWPLLSSHLEAKTFQLADVTRTARKVQVHVSPWEHAAEFRRRIMESWGIAELTLQEVQIMGLNKKKGLVFWWPFNVRQAQNKGGGWREWGERRREGGDSNESQRAEVSKLCLYGPPSSPPQPLSSDKCYSST